MFKVVNDAGLKRRDSGTCKWTYDVVRRTLFYMGNVNPNFIERYQIILEKKPESQVFAALAEAYRKMGLVEQAIRTCNQGIQHNPEFASGYIALARALMTQKKYTEAIKNLKSATQLSPENLLAHQLLGESYLIQKKPKEALGSYKMVLFLNPLHSRAQNAVKKLESLSADEYEDDVFSMEKLSSVIQRIDFEVDKKDLHIEEDPIEKQKHSSEFIDRYLSLVDAYVARNDFEKAQKALLAAEQKLGHLPEIDKRKQFIFKNNQGVSATPKPTAESLSPLSAHKDREHKKLHVLQNLLHSLQQNSKY